MSRTEALGLGVGPCARYVWGMPLGPGMVRFEWTDRGNGF